MAGLSFAIQVRCTSGRLSPSAKFQHQIRASASSSFRLKPFLKELQQNNVLERVPKIIKEASVKFLDTFVDLAFEFIDQPLLPSQSNFAPVEELGKTVLVTGLVDGAIPDNFPEGAYIRNGPNPLFGGLKSTNSVFGASSNIWVEGEGMLHALYFSKDSNGRWIISYTNRYVETDTYKIEKERSKPAFLPAIEGQSGAVLSAYLLNRLRFGYENKFLSNTSVFEHSGKLYSISENHLPQEIDIHTLETGQNWDINGAWKRPFTSHPKKDPETGELVIMGIYPQKPYFELGVISADGKKLLHKVDLKLSRCSLCHEIGITDRSNVVLDFPVTIDIRRVISGGPLIKHEKEGYARIGILPRYGDSDSVKWFGVKPGCALHIINCYEDDEEVVVMACRARDSILPGPDFGLNKFEWFSNGFTSVEEAEKTLQGMSFFSCAYEWRLNMRTGEVKERNLTGTEYSMDFPMINEKYNGKDNRFAYTQTVDFNASSIAGMPKFGGLAKLHLKESKLKSSSGGEQNEDLIKTEYHKFPENTFCSGAAFVPKQGGNEEDDGWMITYVHNEDSNTSQVYVVDAKRFTSEPVAIVTIPSRVPYGFHGAFVPECTRR